MGNGIAPVATIHHDCARMIVRMPDRRVTHVPLIAAAHATNWADADDRDPRQ